MTTSIFGSIVPSAAIEQAVRDTLQSWMPTYLAEITRQQIPSISPGDLPLPRSYSMRSRELAHYPQDQIPAILIISPGTITPPHRAGGGEWSGQWELAVGALCSASTEERTRQLASWYSAAARAVVAQHPSLGGLATGTHWQGERTDVGPALDAELSLAVCQQTFIVHVNDVLVSPAGPIDPDPLPDPIEPYPDWPEIETLIFEIEKQPL